MTDPLARLAEAGLTLPPAPRPNATYVPTTRSGDTVYVSGQLAFDEHGKVHVTGKLGTDHDVAAGRRCAEVCALNLLAQLHEALVDLRHIEQLLKLHVYVAADPSFTEHHLVANGASNLIVHVLGDVGKHARSAIGMVALPLGAAVEVEAIVEIID